MGGEVDAGSTCAGGEGKGARKVGGQGDDTPAEEEDEEGEGRACVCALSVRMCVCMCAGVCVCVYLVRMCVWSARVWMECACVY